LKAEIEHEGWMKGVDLVATLLALALLPACNSSSSSDGDDDTDTGTDADSDTDADTDSDTDVGDGCPDYPTPACPYLDDEEFTFLAGDFGDDLRFVAISGWRSLAILAEQEVDGQLEPIVLRNCGEPGLWAEEWAVHRVVEDSSGSLVAMDVFQSEHAVIDVPVALLCDALGCALYRTDHDDLLGETLVPVAGGSVPVSGEMRGLTSVPSVDAQAICVFGNGLLCFDGSEWTTVVEPGSGPLLSASRDACHSTSSDGPIAAGDSGRVLARLEDAILEIDSGTASSLYGGCQGSNALAVVGADGVFASGRVDDLPDGSLIAHTVIDEDIVSMFKLRSYGIGLNYARVATASGLIREIEFTGYDGDEPQLAGEGAFPGPVFSARIVQCGMAEYVLAVSEDAIYGVLDEHYGE